MLSSTASTSLLIVSRVTKLYHKINQFPAHMICSIILFIIKFFPNYLSVLFCHNQYFLHPAKLYCMVIYTTENNYQELCRIKV